MPDFNPPTNLLIFPPDKPKNQNNYSSDNPPILNVPTPIIRGGDVPTSDKEIKPPPSPLPPPLLPSSAKPSLPTSSAIVSPPTPLVSSGSTIKPTLPTGGLPPASALSKEPALTPPVSPEVHKFFIRTMENDLWALKKGQKPSKIETSLPVSLTGKDKLSSGSSPVSSPASVRKIEDPQRSINAILPQITGGLKEKAQSPAPISKSVQLSHPPSPLPPKAPIIVPSPIVAPKLSPIPNKEIISLGSNRSEKKPVSLKDQDGINPPAFSKKLSLPSFHFGKNVLIVLGLVLVFGLSGLWFFFKKSSSANQLATPVPSSGTSLPTPTIRATPTTKATPTATASKLSGFFTARYLFPIKAGDRQIASLSAALATLRVKDQSKKIFLQPLDSNSKNYIFSAFLENFSIGYPADLLSSLDQTDFGLVVFKQGEKFDKNGLPIPAQFDDSRLALVTRVTDAKKAGSYLSSWEATISSDLEEAFSLPNSVEAFFQGNTYKETKIRYANFFYPDRSIDYAIVTAKNNDDYLVIANSREEIFSIIDTLLGF